MLFNETDAIAADNNNTTNSYTNDISSADRNVRNKIEEKDNQSVEIDRPLTKSLNFGIESILKLHNDVRKVRKHEVKKQTTSDDENNTECMGGLKQRRQSSKYSEDVNYYSDNDSDSKLNEDNEEKMKIKTKDNNEKYSIESADGVHEDITTSMETYIHFPLAFHTLRSSGLSLSNQQALLPGATWSSALMNDIRKERFSSVRRVGHPYQNRTPPKRKKPRTSFTRLQIVELEKRFEKQKYLASTERSALAKSLKMSDAQVKTWFQNRRTKWRRQTAEERELERQAANRLILSLQSEANRKSALILSPDRLCLSQLQRFQESRDTDI